MYDFINHINHKQQNLDDLVWSFLWTSLGKSVSRTNIRDSAPLLWCQGWNPEHCVQQASSLPPNHVPARRWTADGDAPKKSNNKQKV